MALGINEGINDADRAAVRDLLTNIGLGVSLAEEDERENVMRTFVSNHLDHPRPIVAAVCHVLNTAIEPFSTYNVLAELLGVAE